jgi:very-short-patch-repair endonuclease
MSDVILRVRRPQLTRCPAPPESIAPWLISGWDDPHETPVFAESRNETIVDDQSDGEPGTRTVRFKDDDDRLLDWEKWLDLRTAWSTPERTARAAMAFFEAFYEIHSILEKDGERMELLAADGRLSWAATSSLGSKVDIDHPILLKRVELHFDPNVPEFTVRETDREPELYNALFIDLNEVEHAALRNRKSDLEAAGYHPFGWSDTEAFLRAFVQTLSPLAGEFIDGSAKPPLDTTPRLCRDQMLILRERAFGIANAVDAILSDIESQEAFPPALGLITGTVGNGTNPAVGDGPSGTETAGGETNAIISDDEILLAKEANQEQMQIIRRLEFSGSVIVQGPPGTGKTHTIGNLIGHLLAHGKSVLVTAQTAKALRVVRDKVPDALQPLCVSVLGSDQAARAQLESSINSISERLTGDTSDSLLSRAQALTEERRDLLTKAKEISHRLRDALENEYRDVEIGNTRYSPSDAAKQVFEGSTDHAWIPSPVKLGASLTLTAGEIERLYVLNAAFTSLEEEDARSPLPNLSDLPTQRQFQTFVTEYDGLLQRDLSEGADKWRDHEGDSSDLTQIARQIDVAFSAGESQPPWRPYAIVAGMRGGGEREGWVALIEAIEKAAEANARFARYLHLRPVLSQSQSVHRQLQLSREILIHLESGGKLGWVQRTTRSEWGQFIKTTSVTAGSPSHPDHFEAISRLAELEVSRVELEALWNQHIGGRASKPFASLGENPELACRAVVPEIARFLAWGADVWAPITASLDEAGLTIDELIAAQPRPISQIADYVVIERFVANELTNLLRAEDARRRLQECERWFLSLASLSDQIDPSATNRGCVAKLIAAAHERNADSYADALRYAERLWAIRPLVAERGELLNKLRLVAPAWAESVASRHSPHDGGTAPGSVHEAWTWRQLNDILAERDKLDAQLLQRELDATRANIRTVTQRLIDANAWGRQLARLQSNNPLRQALVGWLDTAKRLISTRLRSRRQALETEARKLMRNCWDAVPVWIMPINIMAESFDPTSARFDVVIIDEASQADLNALIPLYMGKQVIVVGDHEQVTPLGVGQNVSSLDNLRSTMLDGIPNAHLYDSLSSIYDIGRQSFGDAIRLVEHFRCVPEIIAFSNQLSYEGKIQPLREANSTNLKPACVSRKVNGFRNGDINEGEAQSIVSTIKAMIRHPAYAGKTIGVISMIGEGQAVKIQTLLQKEVDGVELLARRIQAGISSQFQGDERDIIFLSMVDSSPEEGTLRTTGVGAFEQTKKRYNVAASRARDQLWVVHSFDPNLNLKSADLRFQLLRHVLDPQATLRAFETEKQRTESPFEKEVLKRLTAAGYRVRTQWKVGYYRIDMVVEGGGRRLAIECDGDRWHSLDDLPKDMERQAVLERLGWEFVRIRGSAFYRNRDQALQPLFERLEALDIPKEAGVEGDANTSDMTLVHELDDLIAKGFDGPPIVNAAPVSSPPSILPAPAPPQKLKPEQVEIDTILGRFGSIAPYEDVLKEMSRMRGFQRLGRNVRSGLERDLARLARRGWISIRNGYVRKE